jgi:hypothetical protein
MSISRTPASALSYSTVMRPLARSAVVAHSSAMNVPAISNVDVYVGRPGTH